MIGLTTVFSPSRSTHGGGICTFISSSIPFKRRSDLESPDHECMWLWLRPLCQPCPLSGIIIGAMYFPEAPPDLQRTCANCIIECIDSVTSAHPDCGVLLLGDFNTLNVMNILAKQTLKQLFREPTRGNNILDLVISNLASYYNKPVVSVHLGSSDHRSVYWVPNSNHGSNNLMAKKKVVKMHRSPVSVLNAFGRWVSVHSWFAHVRSWLLIGGQSDIVVFWRPLQRNQNLLLGKECQTTSDWQTLDVCRN